MAKSKPIRSESFERLASRVQRAALEQTKRKDYRLTVGRMPDESEADWARLLEEIEADPLVELTQHEDGSVEIRWDQAIASEAGA